MLTVDWPTAVAFQLSVLFVICRSLLGGFPKVSWTRLLDGPRRLSGCVDIVLKLPTSWSLPPEPSDTTVMACKPYQGSPSTHVRLFVGHVRTALQSQTCRCYRPGFACSALENSDCESLDEFSRNFRSSPKLSNSVPLPLSRASLHWTISRS